MDGVVKEDNPQAGEVNNVATNTLAVGVVNNAGANAADGVVNNAANPPAVAQAKRNLS